MVVLVVSMCSVVVKVVIIIVITRSSGSARELHRAATGCLPISTDFSDFLGRLQPTLHSLGSVSRPNSLYLTLLHSTLLYIHFALLYFTRKSENSVKIGKNRKVVPFA